MQFFYFCGVEFFGYSAAIGIGVVLGLIGGGGSILTVPIMVYLLAIEPVAATGYSLFVVGITALVGTVDYMRKGLVSYKTAIVFGIPAIVGVFVTRMYIIPALPNVIMQVGTFQLSKATALMVLFSALMLSASLSMIKGRSDKGKENEQQKFNYPLILAEGVVVGILTGLIGSGGGFLVVPALVILSKLSMKMAVGTSLAIVTVKSLIGFLGDVANTDIDWQILIPFTIISIIGFFIGSYLSNFISGNKLKPAFGWFVLIMGFYILGRELVF